MPLPITLTEVWPPAAFQTGSCPSSKIPYPGRWAWNFVPFPSCQRPHLSIPHHGGFLCTICIQPTLWSSQFLSRNPQGFQKRGYLNGTVSRNSKLLIAADFTPKCSISHRDILSLAPRNASPPTCRHKKSLGGVLPQTPPESPSLRSLGQFVPTLSKNTIRCHMYNFMTNSASAKVGADRGKKPCTSWETWFNPNYCISANPHKPNKALWINYMLFSLLFFKVITNVTMYQHRSARSHQAPHPASLARRLVKPADVTGTGEML